MNQTDLGVFILDNYFTSEEVDYMHKAVEHLPWTSGSIGPGIVTDADGTQRDNGIQNSKIRQSDIKWAPPGTFGEEIDNKFVAGVNHANIQAGWNYNWQHVEHHQYTVYHHREEFDDEWAKAVKDGRAVSGDHYTWHQDSARNEGGIWPGEIRKLSTTIQLSDPDEYEGGDFQYINFSGVFDKITESNQRSFDLAEKIETVPFSGKGKGTLIVFPSYTFHQVSPVTRGTRKSLVSWFHGPKFV